MLSTTSPPDLAPRETLPTAPHHLVQEAYDELAAVYDQSFTRPIDHAENTVAHQQLLALGLTEGRVLDLGCGTGLLIEQLGIPPDQYVGLDISARMIARAMTKFPDHTWVCGDMAAMPVAETDSFQHWLGGGAWNLPFNNAVSMFGSFSYVLDPVPALQKVYERLAPDGAFCFMLLSRNYAHRASHITEHHGMHVPYVGYTAAEAWALAVAAGFQHVRVWGFNAYADRLPGWLPARMVAWYLWWEQALLGWKDPDRFLFLFVYGRRG